MQAANPYEEGTTRYQRFEKTYYAGILVFEITLTVAAGAASTTKQTATA